ncbi:hypothetical protein D3C86_1537820 [compost metagenome]
MPGGHREGAALGEVLEQGHPVGGVPSPFEQVEVVQEEREVGVRLGDRKGQQPAPRGIGHALAQPVVRRSDRGPGAEEAMEQEARHPVLGRELEVLGRAGGALTPVAELRCLSRARPGAQEGGACGGMRGGAFHAPYHSKGHGMFSGIVDDLSTRPDAAGRVGRRDLDFNKNNLIKINYDMKKQSHFWA